MSSTRGGVVLKQLLYHDGTVGAIFFPVGKLEDGGTCEFATKRCLEECGLKQNAITLAVYKYIREESVAAICTRILKDLTNFPDKLLYWFASGDCPKDMEDKVIKLMRAMDACDLVQHGFTRNKSLWRRVSRISDRLKLILTVETKKLAKEINGPGLVAVPNYKYWKADIYALKEGKGKIVHLSSCGGGWTEHVEHVEQGKVSRVKVTEEDCSICYNEKIGCFRGRRKKC